MDSPGIARDQYSEWVGMVYVFNLIVGTGALTLPSVFVQAGWMLGSSIIIVLAIISFITVTFVIESMSCANAIVHWKHLRMLKKDRIYHHSVTNVHNSDQNSEDDLSSSDDNEGEPLFHNACRYYDLDRKLELGEMAMLFFNKPGRALFYLCFCVYLYGDLSIYSAAVSKSLADITCTFQPNDTENTTIRPDSICWPGNSLTQYEAYRLYLGAFALTLGPFVFFNVQKTKYLQVMTSSMRWLAFSIMIGLATHRLLIYGPVGHPKPAHFPGVPVLFGACVYSFMCHHSLPGLLTPIQNKTHLKKLVFVDYTLICAVYLLLALTGAFAFEHLNDLYTLNFSEAIKGETNIILKVVDYFLAMFPIFTLSTSFPIIAITLKNNLVSLFLNTDQLPQYNFLLRDVLFPVLAILPPILIAFFTEDLDELVMFTGSYAGTGIQYLIPTFLVYNARKTCTQILGLGIKNPYKSPFSSNFWVVFVVLWSITCAILVTMNFIRKVEES